MTIDLRHLLLVLGGTLALIGLLLGILPTSYDGGTCGAAFGDGRAMDAEALRRTMIGTGDGWLAFQDGCTDARNGRRTIALALTIPGLLLAVAGLFVGSSRHEKDAATLD